jgi:hypothetical protein
MRVSHTTIRVHLHGQSQQAVFHTRRKRNAALVRPCDLHPPTNDFWTNGRVVIKSGMNIMATLVSFNFQLSISTNMAAVEATPVPFMYGFETPSTQNYACKVAFCILYTKSAQLGSRQGPICEKDKQFRAAVSSVVTRVRFGREISGWYFEFTCLKIRLYKNFVSYVRI